MKIELRLPDRLGLPLQARTYDAQLDTVGSIFSDITDFLAEQIPDFEARRGMFTAAGFGQDPWPVDVWMDLPVLLEQLPMAIAAINARAPFEIDFHEQGTQRKVAFRAADSGYVATCLSY